MKGGWQSSILIAVLVCSASLSGSSPALAGKQVLTGEVGDAIAVPSTWEGAPAECTHTCVSHGSKYALVVGDKIYVLNTSDKTVLALLDQQAGKKATVTGTVNGTVIEVSTAVVAK